MRNIAHSKSLPYQHLPEKKKDKKFIKATLDKLEQIGLNAISVNKKFDSYYRMIEGKMTYEDYGLDSTTKEIRQLREDVGLSNSIMHYDFLSRVSEQVAGEYLRTKGKMVVDTIDPISRSEYMTEKTNRLNEYVSENIEKTIDMELVKRGVVMEDSFESEEQKQEYLQYLEEQKNSIIPPDERERDLAKNFKTPASKWGTLTLERDAIDFEMDNMNAKEIESKFLTGRWFRHYFVGYDFYMPEFWDAREVFFDESRDIEYPQYGEYVGRVTEMTGSAFLNRYGYQIPEKTQVKLARALYGDGDSSSEPTPFNKNFDYFQGKNYVVPYEGYFEDQERKWWEKTLDTPFGHYIQEDEEGNVVKIPTWLSNPGGGFSNSRRSLRGDIDERIDTLRVTEAYWRSYREVAILNFTGESGELESRFVTGELIPEFLEYYGVKKMRTVSLKEATENPQPDTMYISYAPEVRMGVKAVGGAFMDDDAIYLGGHPLEHQIRKDSELMDTVLPVVGYVGKAPVEKMRPYIIMHNIALNQVYSLLEKETGMFLIFDFKYLPSEFKDNEDAFETLNSLYDAIRDVGIVPIDTSNQNLEGQTQQMNTFMTQALDFTGLMRNRIELAEKYKMMALEQFGMSGQRIGQTQTHITAEGIKTGAEATYAQTERFFGEMDASQRKASIVHLHIAQSCYKEGKDYKNYFIRSNGEKAYLEVNDENFPLRMFDIHTFNTAKDKRNLEKVKETILSRNTMDTDILDLAQVVTSDTVQELLDIGMKARARQLEEAEKNRQSQEKMNQDNIEYEEARELREIEAKQTLQSGKNETDLERERIRTYGKMADKSVYDRELYDRVDKLTESSKRDENLRLDRELEREKLNLNKLQIEEEKRKNLQEYNIKLKDISERAKNRMAREKDSTLRAIQ